MLRLIFPFHAIFNFKLISLHLKLQLNTLVSARFIIFLQFLVLFLQLISLVLAFLTLLDHLFYLLAHLLVLALEGHAVQLIFLQYVVELFEVSLDTLY